MKKFFAGLALLAAFCGLLLAGLFISIAVSSGNSINEVTTNNGDRINNSIAEKQWAEIGGIRQGYFIRSENPNNPVLLYLHGGPGIPETPDVLSSDPNTRLEKFFTVCYWEQRGAGISFNKNLKASGMTIDQLVEDTREMTLILQKRFNKDKIFLMGHSWGTMLGIKTIQKYPDLYRAYIGVGQMSNQVESEKLAYDYMLNHAKAIHDQSTIDLLNKYGPSAAGFPPLDYHLTVRNKTLNKYGVGVFHEKRSTLRMLASYLYFGGYTLGEKINLLKGLRFTEKYLGAASNENLFETSCSFDVPVYFIQGKYDYQVSYSLAKQYFDSISAPGKFFFTFANSAHSPILEEPVNFINTIEWIANKYSGF